MATTKKALDLMKFIINQLEVVLRGGKLNEADYDQLLRHAIELENTAALMRHSTDKMMGEDEKIQVMEASVKLHNKIRNVTISPSYSAIKTYIRCACAEIFLSFGANIEKTLPVVMKLLKKSCEDFWLAKDIHKAKECTSRIAEIWMRCKNQKMLFMVDQLPPIEVQDMKLAVFHALLIDLQIIMDTSSEQLDKSAIEVVSRSVELTFDLLSVLAAREKARVVEIYLLFANRCTSIPEFNTYASSLYEKAIKILDTAAHLEQENTPIRSNAAADDNIQRQIGVLKFRALISLAYLSIGEGKFPPALACIHAVEKLNKGDELNLQHSILFAKLLLAQAEKRPDQCEDHLRALLRSATTPFPTALNAVTLFFSKQMTSIKDLASKIADVYKLLTNKQNSQADQMQVRLSHLHTLLKAATEREEDDTSTFEERARQIIWRFSSDDRRSIASKDMDLIVKTIQERVRLLRLREDWNGVKQWCEVAVSLLEDSENNAESSVIFLVHKADALMNSNAYAEAFDVASKAVGKHLSTRTLLMFYRAMIHIDDFTEDQIVERIKAVHEKALNAMLTGGAILHPSDLLQHIRLCASFLRGPFVQHISTQRKRTLHLGMVRYWLQFFDEHKLWATDDAGGTSAFIAVIDYLRVFLGPFMLLMEGNEDEITGAQVKVMADNLLQALLQKKLDIPIAKYHILGPFQMLESILHAAAEVNLDHSSSLGRPTELCWIAELGGVLGSMLCDAQFASSASAPSILAQIVLLGAEILQTTESLLRMDKNPSEDAQRRARWLITAAAAHLDIGTLLYPNAMKQDEDLPSLVMTYLSTADASFRTVEVSERHQESSMSSTYENCSRKARELAHQAEETLSEYIEFNDATDNKLFCSAVVIEVASYCRSGSLKSCDAFIAQMKDKLIKLSVQDLRTCIELVESSKSFSIDALRKMLEIAADACERTAPVPSFTGWIYRQLIELSPSRTSALAHVKEFDRIVNHSSNRQSIVGEDVDTITSLAFNYGVTLIDLGENELALQFVVASVSLAKNCTAAMNPWLDQLKDTHKRLCEMQHALSAVISSELAVDSDKDVRVTESSEENILLQQQQQRSPEVKRITAKELQGNLTP